MFFKSTLFLIPLLGSVFAASYFQNDQMAKYQVGQNGMAMGKLPIQLNQVTAGKNHSLILGRRVYGDRLLRMDVAKMSSSLFRIVETDLYFPNSKTGRNDRPINFISVIDRKANGNGGWPYLTSGGIGAKNVSLHFKSQRSHGFDFLVSIYGN